ncbi:hypothetical protein [Pseudothauera rhizosphaerae]|uniref:Type II and III secretion system protein n=1 Tax=Pseudothauera rhizosphaerae TaxID=2565932 RepID=A0A4S4ACY5_9RHOO|nr:hypothetical protein [Pseudothauera rhizosphaerae]THF56553.1 hypothetical protein E6O51_19255 [Pseudothauera rhizosphaerae]
MLCALALFLPLAAAAEPALEIIPLRHRPAEQVLPVLRPLLAPGGSLSGFNDKLFVRTNAANLAELRAALAGIDVPAARLLISVRQSADEYSGRSQAEAHGRIGRGRVQIEQESSGRHHHIGTGVVVELGGRERAASSSAEQQVQTVDGGQAFIRAGVSLPVPLRRVWRRPDGAALSETVIWRDLGTGFNASPRVMGGRVSIEISPFDERPLAPDGTAEIRHLSTTVEGALGEWIPLGASTLQAADGERGLLSRGEQTSSGSNEVWLKVERLD